MRCGTIRSALALQDRSGLQPKELLGAMVKLGSHRRCMPKFSDRTRIVPLERKRTMTHYLRRNGDTVVDVEATNDDLRSVVCIVAYSDMLLYDQLMSLPENEKARQSEIIHDFDLLQELRENT